MEKKICTSLSFIRQSELHFKTQVLFLCSLIALSLVFLASGCGSTDDDKKTDSLTLYITVDDSANQTYSDTQIEWKGSFIYNDITNTLVYDGAWTGPFVPLYDDGPLSSGGHEAEGEIAGDFIFSAEVNVTADADYTFEYGMINEEMTWIWPGLNGSVSVTTGQTGRVEAAGMTIAAHGINDLILTLDTASLHADFTPFNPAWTVTVKGTMSGWAECPLKDDGIAPDTAASDGVYTYCLSDNLGPHDGLLDPGDVQFVFVLNGVEYKSGGSPVSDGASAWYNNGGADQPLTISVSPIINCQVTIP